MSQIWELEESDDGCFTLFAGPRGVPGSKEVRGLSKQTAHQLAFALEYVQWKAHYLALENARRALGIAQ